MQASLWTVLQETHDGYIIYTYTSMSFCNSNFDTCYDVYDHAVAWHLKGNNPTFFLIQETVLLREPHEIQSWNGRY